MYPIITKYLGPTNTRGSRIKAYCERGSVCVPYDHALNTDGNHIAARKALCERLILKDQKQNGCPTPDSPWLHYRLGGTLPRGFGMVHVCMSFLLISTER